MENLSQPEKNKSRNQSFRTTLLGLTRMFLARVDSRKLPRIILETINNLKLNAFIEWAKKERLVQHEGPSIRKIREIDIDAIKHEQGYKVLFHGTHSSVEIQKKRLVEGPVIRVVKKGPAHTTFSDGLGIPGQHGQRKNTPSFGLAVEYHLPIDGIATGQLGSRTETYWGLLPGNSVIIEREEYPESDPMSDNMKVTLDPASIKALHVFLYDISKGENDLEPKVLSIRGSNTQLVQALDMLQKYDILR